MPNIKGVVAVMNSEGYKDPTADIAVGGIYHNRGKIDYTKFKTYDELLGYIKNRYEKIRNNYEAEVFIRERMPKESYYQRKIMEWIGKNIPDAVIWKEAAGPYSRQGIPDITCIVNGRYYGFEVKRPFIGKLSKIQKETIDLLNKAGAKAYVVTSEKEVAEILKDEIKGVFDGAKRRE